MNSVFIVNATAWSLDPPLIHDEGDDSGGELVVVNPTVVDPVPGPLPPLSAYELLRKKNMKEIEESMRETLEGIKEDKVALWNSAAAVKRIWEKAKKRKKNKEEPVVELRRTRREKKPVSYLDEECEDTKGNRRRNREDEDSLSPDRLSRKKRSSPVMEKVWDGYIWCTPCGSREYLGCPVHQPVFEDPKQYMLEVERSMVRGKDVGDGIFNRGIKIIKEGVIFGPYIGDFIPYKVYKDMEKKKQESGNAWAVRDKKNEYTVGYVDPGVNLNSSVHWMTKINCPSTCGDLNLMAFQLLGKIYYRAVKDIPPGKELTVYYGDEFAKEVGIKLDVIDKYSGGECHTTAGAYCEYCSTKMNDEKLLEEHISKGELHTHRFRCKAKHDMEMVRMARTGERSHVCLDCWKGFKTKHSLEQHQAGHTKARAFLCDSCAKSYATSSGLDAHIKDKHLGITFQCGECNKQFGKKCNLTSHMRHVHIKEKKYKCPRCGVAFSRKLALTVHIATVHDKIRNFTCEYCSMSFGRKTTRKVHIENVHLKIRYPCIWPECTHEARTKGSLRNHRKRTHTMEWNLECQLCMDQFDKWWGCLYPVQMDKHMAKKHKVEWEEELEVYKRNNPYICKVDRCDNRFSTGVEVERHQDQMH